MKHRAPAARWVATLTITAVLMVLSALAVRMKLGDDPAIGATSASSGTSTDTSTTTTDDDASSVQGLFDDDGSSASGSSSSTAPSSPSTSRAS